VYDKGQVCFKEDFKSVLWQRSRQQLCGRGHACCVAEAKCYLEEVKSAVCYRLYQLCVRGTLRFAMWQRLSMLGGRGVTCLVADFTSVSWQRPKIVWKK
jgi:hypothetical protein